MVVNNTALQNDFLSNLLGSKLRAKALGWLFTHPDERFFVRQLTALLSLDSTNLSRELARLEKMGLLICSTSGRQKYYQVNRENSVFSEIHGLMVKTAGVADVLRSAMALSSQRIDLAFIFGSFANKTENSSSDIDVMVIGDISFGDVVSLFSSAQKALGREINPVVYSRQEFANRISEEHYFIKTILEEPRIVIMGDDSVLNRLAKPGSVSQT